MARALLDPDWGQWSVSHSLLAKVGIGVCVGCSSDRRKRVSQFNCTLHLQPRDSRPIIKCSRRNRLLFFIYTGRRARHIYLMCNCSPWHTLLYLIFLLVIAYCNCSIIPDTQFIIMCFLMRCFLFYVQCMWLLILWSCNEKNKSFNALWIKTALKFLL